MDGILENFNDKDAQSTFNQADVQNNMIVAVLPYIIPILFFIPILVDRNSSFCRFHANQQLTWFITLIIVGIITGIIGIIPILRRNYSRSCRSLRSRRYDNVHYRRC